MAEQNKIVAEYVAEVARLAKTGKTTEYSFRGTRADGRGDDCARRGRDGERHVHWRPVHAPARGLVRRRGESRLVVGLAQGEVLCLARRQVAQDVNLQRHDDHRSIADVSYLLHEIAHR